MVLRASDCIGQSGEAKLLETREKFLEMLSPEQPKHPLFDRLRALARGDHEL
ncbi:MAG: hypothetical protein K0U93_16985 [Gammaproteobacteria bacterium]|nr:hypothetical protein [Gammaproteobacteria bacterium]